nr:hypothetical protein [Providencia rettgeri]
MNEVSPYESRRFYQKEHHSEASGAWLSGGGALQLAADEGIAHYRRCSQASKRGAMFDDCFHVAKVWMDKYGGNTKAKPKRRGKTVVKQVSLFWG